MHLALIPQGNRSQGSVKDNNTLIIRANSTHEGITLTFALISIGGVEEEWRWADALARLDTLLVGAALPITTASSLCGGTQTVVGVATVSIRAHTIVASLSIVTICSVSAHLPSLSTFVNIGARAIGLGTIAFGTGTIT